MCMQAMKGFGFAVALWQQWRLDVSQLFLTQPHILVHFDDDCVDDVDDGDVYFHYYIYIDDVFKLLWLKNDLQLLFHSIMSMDESSRGGKLCQWNKTHRSPEVGHHGTSAFSDPHDCCKSLDPGSEVFSIRCFWCFLIFFWTSDYQIFQEKCLHQPAFACQQCLGCQSWCAF